MARDPRFILTDLAKLFDMDDVFMTEVESSFVSDVLGRGFLLPQQIIPAELVIERYKENLP